MKLDLQLSEKDKKLLMFLGIFVIVVGFGFLAIRPLVNANVAVTESLSDAQDEKDMREQKVSMLDSSQIVYDALSQKMKDRLTDFYPVMRSEEIDKLVTGIIVSYDLFSRDLTIAMPKEEITLEPYIYSDAAQAQTGQAQQKQSSSSSSTDASGETTAEVMTGIYAANVSITAVGSRTKAEKMIDALARDYPSMRVCSYSWSKDLETTGSGNQTGQIILKENTVLNMQVEVYMCDKDEGVNENAQETETQGAETTQQ